MKKTIKKLVAGAALLATLACAAPKPAQAGGTAELTAGNRDVALDVKAFADIAPRTTALFRTRTVLDYENNPWFLGVTDLNIKIAGGLEALAEAKVTSDQGFVPWAGLQYSHQYKDLFMYAAGMCSIGKKPIGEAYAILSYKPKIKGELKLLTNLEAITDFGAEGHKFSIQRWRLGVEYKGVGVGAAADVHETGNKPDISYNVGGFVSKKF
jgi:hypothetical protein